MGKISAFEVSDHVQKHFAVSNTHALSHICITVNLQEPLQGSIYRRLLRESLPNFDTVRYFERNIRPKKVHLVKVDFENDLEENEEEVWEHVLRNGKSW